MTRAASSARPASIDSVRAAASRAHQAVDDRQVELRILRAELIDDRAGLVDQVEIRAHAAQADRPALGHEDLHRRRQHPAQADLRDPWRLDQPPPERLEIDAQDAGPAQVVDERLHFAARQADVAVHADAGDPQQRRREREGDALVDTEHEQQRG